MAALLVGMAGSLLAADLTDFLPHHPDWKPAGPAVTADSAEALFAAINGGAERFLHVGFKRALYQTYTRSPGERLNFEIIETTGPDAARTLFSGIADGGTDAAIGDAAKVFDYYLIFIQGPYYVSLTADGITSDVDVVLKELVEKMMPPDK